MGKSNKPDIDYGLHDSYNYAWKRVHGRDGLEEHITLVLPDWGSGMGFYYANLYRDSIKAISIIEAMPPLYDPGHDFVTSQQGRKGFLCLSVSNCFQPQAYLVLATRCTLYGWQAHFFHTDHEVVNTLIRQQWLLKLCLYVTPGVAIKGENVKVIPKAFKNTEMMHLGEGLHFIQEDYPHEIGEAISKWYTKSVSSQ